MTSDDVAALHAVVHGRVQGVGFRFFVRRQAVEHGLSGWVRNLDGDATVEVQAEGPRSGLEGLLRAIRSGPPMAFVERVDVEWGPAS
ncbi:MAG TPA: acylphosphatase, partial [Dehalococcoidia bacterium]